MKVMLKLLGGYSQIIGGIQSNYWEDISPPGFRHPCQGLFEIFILRKIAIAICKLLH